MNKTLLLLALIGMLAGCDSDSKPADQPYAYRPVIVSNFMNSCTKGKATPEQCACVIDIIMEKIPEDDFLAEERKQTSGKGLSEAFTNMTLEAVKSCM